MKKFFSVLMILCLLPMLFSCSEKPKSLDLTAAQAAVDELELFGMVLDPSDAELETLYGIDPALIEKGLFQMYAVIVQASSYMVVLPKEGKQEELKEQLDGYIDMLTRNFEGYLPDQYAMVQNCMHTTLETQEGTYLVYIVSADNDAVLQAIESALIQES